MRFSPSKFIAAGLSICYFTTQVALGSVAESNLWNDRRASARPKTERTQLASLPGALPINSIDGRRLTDGMPDIHAALPAGRGNENQAAAPESLRAVLAAIPAQAATVQEMNGGRNGGSPVVIVQDIHLNPEAQANIAAVVSALSTSGAVSAIGVEGAFGAFDFSKYRAFPNVAIVGRVAKAFLDERLLSGASFAGINGGASVPMTGVDDVAAYDANVSAYLQSRQAMDARAAELSKISARIDSEKAAVLAPELLSYDRARAGYRDGKLPLGAYLKELSARSEAEFVVERFLAAHAMESRLDFDRVAAERRAVIEKLVRSLDESEVNALLARSAAYRVGRVTYASYYGELKALCARKGVDLAASPAFDEYIRYVLMADSIRADDLFSAMERMDNAAVRRLADTPEALSLIETADAVALSEKLVRFELVPAEWKRYTVLRAERAIELKGRAMPDLASFENFYRRAEERSELMVKRLSSLGSGAHALVTGGFHTPEIAALLRHRGVPYMIVSPKITKADANDGSAYLSVFAREKTPLDRLFAGEKLFVTPAAVNVAGGHPASVPTDRRLRFEAAYATREAGETVPAATGVSVVSENGSTRRLTVDGIEAEESAGAAADPLSQRLGTQVRATRDVLSYVTAPFRAMVRFAFMRIATLTLIGILTLSPARDAIAQAPVIPPALREEQEKNRIEAAAAERRAREAEAAATAELNALSSARALVARGESNLLNADGAVGDLQNKKLEVETAVSAAAERLEASRADAAQLEGQIKEAGRATTTQRTDLLRMRLRQAEIALEIIDARRKVIVADADVIAGSATAAREGATLATARAGLARLNNDKVEAAKQDKEAQRLTASSAGLSARSVARRAETTTLDADRATANTAFTGARQALSDYEARVREAQRTLGAAERAASGATERRVRAEESVVTREGERTTASTTVDAAKGKEKDALAASTAASDAAKATPRDRERQAASLRAKALHLAAVVERGRAETAFDKSTAVHETAQAAADEASALEAEAKAGVADVRRQADEARALRAAAVESRASGETHKALARAAQIRAATRDRDTLPGSTDAYRAAWTAYRTARTALDRDIAAAAPAVKVEQPQPNAKMETQRRAVEDLKGKAATADRVVSDASSRAEIARTAFERATGELTGRETRATLAAARVRELEAKGAKTRTEVATLERARADAAVAKRDISEQKIAVVAARANATVAEKDLDTRIAERDAASARLVAARVELDRLARVGEMALQSELDQRREEERRRAAEMPPVEPEPIAAPVMVADAAQAPAAAAEFNWAAFVDDIAAQIAAEKADEAERAAVEAPNAPPAPAANAPIAAAAPEEDAGAVSLSEVAADEARVASSGPIGYFLGITGSVWMSILAIFGIRRAAGSKDEEEEAEEPATAPASSILPTPANVLGLTAKGEGDIELSIELKDDGTLIFTGIKSNVGVVTPKYLVGTIAPRANGRPISIRFTGTRTMLSIAVPGQTERMRIPVAPEGRLEVVTVGDRVVVRHYQDAGSKTKVGAVTFTRMAARFGFFADLGLARHSRTPERVASAAAFNTFLKTGIAPASDAPTADGKRRVPGKTVWDAIRRLRAVDPAFWGRASEGVAWVASRRAVEREAAAPAAPIVSPAPASPIVAPAVEPVVDEAPVREPARSPWINFSRTPLRLTAAAIGLVILLTSAGAFAATMFAMDGQRVELKDVAPMAAQPIEETAIGDINNIWTWALIIGGTIAVYLAIEAGRYLMKRTALGRLFGRAPKVAGLPVVEEKASPVIAPVEAPSPVASAPRRTIGNRISSLRASLGARLQRSRDAAVAGAAPFRAFVLRPTVWIPAVAIISVVAGYAGAQLIGSAPFGITAFIIVTISVGVTGYMAGFIITRYRTGGFASVFGWLAVGRRSGRFGEGDLEQRSELASRPSFAARIAAMPRRAFASIIATATSVAEKTRVAEVPSWALITGFVVVGTGLVLGADVVSSGLSVNANRAFAMRLMLSAMTAVLAGTFWILLPGGISGQFRALRARVTDRAYENDRVVRRTLFAAGNTIAGRAGAALVLPRALAIRLNPSTVRGERGLYLSKAGPLGERVSGVRLRAGEIIPFRLAAGSKLEGGAITEPFVAPDEGATLFLQVVENGEVTSFRFVAVADAERTVWWSDILGLRNAGGFRRAAVIALGFVAALTGITVAVAVVAWVIHGAVAVGIAAVGMLVITITLIGVQGLLSRSYGFLQAAGPFAVNVAEIVEGTPFGRRALNFMLTPLRAIAARYARFREASRARSAEATALEKEGRLALAAFRLPTVPATVVQVVVENALDVEPLRVKRIAEGGQLIIRQSPTGTTVKLNDTEITPAVLAGIGIAPVAGEALPMNFILQINKPVQINVQEGDNALYATARPANSNLNLLMQIDSEGAHLVALGDKEIGWNAADMHDMVRLFRAMGIRPIARAGDLNEDNARSLIEDRLADALTRPAALQALSELRAANPVLHGRLGIDTSAVFLGLTWSRRTIAVAAVLVALATVAALAIYFIGYAPAAAVTTMGEPQMQAAGMGPLGLLGLLLGKSRKRTAEEINAAPAPTPDMTRFSRRNIRRGSVSVRLLVSFLLTASAVVGAAAIGVLPGRPKAPVAVNQPVAAPIVNAPAAPPVVPVAPVVPPVAPVVPPVAPVVPPVAPAAPARVPEISDVMKALAAQGEGEKAFKLADEAIRKLEGELPKAEQGVAYQTRQYEIALRGAAASKRELAIRDRLDATVGGLYAAGVYQPAADNDGWLRVHGNHKAFEPNDKLWRVADEAGKPAEFADAASFDAFIKANAARIHVYLGHVTPEVQAQLGKRFTLGADGEIMDLSSVDVLRREKIDVEVWVGSRADRAASYRLVMGKNAGLVGAARALEDAENRDRQIRLLETLLALRPAPGVVVPLAADGPVLPLPVFGADMGVGLVARLPEPAGKRAIPGARFPALRDQLNVTITVDGAKRTVNLIDLGSAFAARQAAPNALQTTGAAGRHRTFWSAVGPQVLQDLPGATALPAAHGAGAVNTSNRHALALDLAAATMADPKVTFESAQDAVRRSGLAHWTAHAGESAGLFFPALGQDDSYYAVSGLVRYLDMMADNTDTAIASSKAGARVPAQPVADIRPAIAGATMNVGVRRDIEALALKLDDLRFRWEGGERDGGGGVIRHEPIGKSLLKTLGDAPDANRLILVGNDLKVGEVAGLLEQTDALIIQVLTHPDVVADPALRTKLMGALDWRGALVRERMRNAEIVGRGRAGAGRDAVRQQVLNSILVQQGVNLPKLWADTLRVSMKASGAEPAFAGWVAAAPAAAAVPPIARRAGVDAATAPRIERQGLPDAGRQATVKLPPPTARVELTPFERPDVADLGPYRFVPGDIRVTTRVKGQEPKVDANDLLPAARAGRFIPARRPLVTPLGKAAPALPITPAPAGSTFDYVLVNNRGDAVLSLTGLQLEELREAGWIHFTEPAGRAGDTLVSPANLLAKEDPRRRMFIADPERVALHVRAPLRGVPLMPPAFGGPLPAAGAIAPWVIAPDAGPASAGLAKAGGYEVLGTLGEAIARADDAKDDAAAAKADAAMAQRLRDTDDYVLTNRDRTVWGGFLPLSEQRIIEEAGRDADSVRIFLPTLGRYISLADFESPIWNTDVAREVNKGRYTLYRKAGAAYVPVVTYDQLTLLGREIVFDGDTGRRLTHAEALSPLRNSNSLVRYVYVGGNLLETAHPDTIFPDLQNMADIRDGFALDLKQVNAGDRAAAQKTAAAQERLRLAAQNAFVSLKGIGGPYAVIVRGEPNGPARTDVRVPVVGAIASKEDFEREFGVTPTKQRQKLEALAKNKGFRIILTDGVSLSLDKEGRILEAKAADMTGGNWTWRVAEGVEDKKIEGAVYAMRIGRKGEIHEVLTAAQADAQLMTPRTGAAAEGRVEWALVDPAGVVWPMSRPGNYRKADLDAMRERGMTITGFDKVQQEAPLHTRFSGFIHIPTNDTIQFGHASVSKALKTRLGEYRRLQNQSMLLIIDGLSALDSLPKREINLGNGVMMPVGFDFQQIGNDLRRPSFLPMGNPTVSALARIQLANEGILLRQGEAWAAPQMDDSEFRLSAFYPAFNLGRNTPLEAAQLPPRVIVRTADERERSRQLAVPLLMPVNIDEEGLVYEFDYRGTMYNLNFGKQAAQRGIRESMQTYLIGSTGVMRKFNGGVEIDTTVRVKGTGGSYPVTTSQAFVGAPDSYIVDLAKAGVNLDRDMATRYEVGTNRNGRGELSGTRTVRVRAIGGVAGAQISLFEAAKQEELSKAATDLRIAGGGELRIEYVAKRTGDPTVTIVKTEGAAGIAQAQKRVQDAIAAIPAAELRYDAASKTYSHHGRVIYSVRSHWLYEYDAKGQPTAASQVIFSADLAAGRADRLDVEAADMAKYLDVLKQGGVVETNLTTRVNTYRVGPAAYAAAQKEVAARPVGEQIEIGRTQTYTVDAGAGVTVQKTMYAPPADVRARARDAAEVPSDAEIRRKGGVLTLNGQTGALESMDVGPDAIVRAMGDLTKNFDFADREKIDSNGYRFDLGGKHIIIIFGQSDFARIVGLRLIAAEQARDEAKRAVELAKSGLVPPNFAEAFTVSELMPGYGEPGKVKFDRDGFVKTRVTNLVTGEVSIVTADSDGNLVHKKGPEFETDYNRALQKRVFDERGVRSAIPARTFDARGVRITYTAVPAEDKGVITGFTLTGTPAAARPLPQGVETSVFEIYQRGKDVKDRPIMDVRKVSSQDNAGRSRFAYDAGGFLTATHADTRAAGNWMERGVSRPRVRNQQAFVDNGGNFLHDAVDATGQPSVRHISPLGAEVRVDAGPKTVVNGNFARHPDTGAWLPALSLSMTQGEPSGFAIIAPAAGGRAVKTRYVAHRLPGRDADGRPQFGRTLLAGETTDGLGYLESRRFTYQTQNPGDPKSIWIRFDTAAEKAAFDNHGVVGVELGLDAYDRDPSDPAAKKIRVYTNKVENGRVTQNVRLAAGAQDAIDAIVAAQPNDEAKASVTADFKLRMEKGVTTTFELRAMSFWDGAKEVPFKMMVPVERVDQKGGKTTFHYDVPNAYGLATRATYNAGDGFSPELTTMLTNVRGEPYVDRVTGAKLVDTPISPMNQAGKEGLFRFQEVRVAAGKAVDGKVRYMNQAGMFVLEEPTGKTVRASDFVPHPISGDFSAQKAIVIDARGTVDEITIYYDPITGEQREVTRPLDKDPGMGRLDAADNATRPRAAWFSLRALRIVGALLIALFIATPDASAQNPAPKPATPATATAEVKRALVPSTVAAVRNETGAFLNVNGQLWSGAPGFAYQPTPDGMDIIQFERGNMANLYKALLPVDGRGIDARKYPDLVRLAKSNVGAPAQGHAELLAKRANAKFIRTYNLASTTEADLKLVARIFTWMYEEHGIMFTAGLYDPTEAQIRATAAVLKGVPGLLIYDGWNEVDMRGGTVETIARIDKLAGVLKSVDKNHSVALVLTQNASDAILKAVREAKNIDLLSVTIYDRNGAASAKFLADLQKKMAPKVVTVGEIGVDMKPAPDARAARLKGISEALVTVAGHRPGPAPLVVFFELTPEKYKGDDNKWWFIQGGVETPSLPAVNEVHKNWVPALKGPLDMTAKVVVDGAPVRLTPANGYGGGAQTWYGTVAKPPAEQATRLLLADAVDVSVTVGADKYAGFTGFHFQMNPKEDFSMPVVREKGQAWPKTLKNGAVFVSADEKTGTVTYRIPGAAMINVTAISELHVQTGQRQNILGTDTPLNAANVTDIKALVQPVKVQPKAGRGTLPLGVRFFGEGYLRHAFWVETLIFAALPALIGQPVVSLLFIGAFVGLHYVDRGALQGTGVRVSTGKVIGLAIAHGLAIAVTAAMFSAAPSVESVLAVVAMMGAVTTAHFGANRVLPAASYLSDDTMSIVRALARSGNVESRRAAIIELIEGDTQLRLDLDSLGERARTGHVAGDLSEILSRRFNAALAQGAPSRGISAIALRSEAGLRQLLTGEASDTGLFGGSLGALHDNAVRSATEEDRAVLNYQFIAGADPVEAVRQAQESAQRLFSKEGVKVGLVLVVENAATRNAVRLAMQNSINPVEVVLRGDNTRFSFVRDAALQNPRIAAMAERADNRLLMPAQLALPEGFFDLGGEEMARYRMFVLILDALNAIAIEIRSQDLDRMSEIQKLVSSQA